MKTIAEIADFTTPCRVKIYPITIKQLTCLISGISCHPKVRWRTAAGARYMCLKAEAYGDH